MKAIVLILSLSLVAVGCAMKQKKVIHALEHPAPVNCATAEGDLRVLQAEKANVAERVAEGVSSVVPAGAALGILTWTEPNIFMNNYTERTWTLVTINQAVRDLVKTYIQYPPRKLQREVYTGPITLTQQYQRFQHIREALKNEGVSLPLPTGN